MRRIIIFAGLALFLFGPWSGVAKELIPWHRPNVPTIQGTRTPIILDTDIGSDIDDAVALAWLLARSDCELVGITTVSGEPEQRARISSALCRAAGREIPIHPGLAAPLGLKAVIAGCAGILLLLCPPQAKLGERAAVAVVALYGVIVVWNSAVLAILAFG